MIRSLKTTLTPESFQAHLDKMASDEQAVEARHAELVNLTERVIPELRVAEERIA